MKTELPTNHSKFAPYPKYKPSGVEWLGEIPEHWDTKRLKYCARLVNDKVDGCKSDLPYTGLEHIESWTGKRIVSEELATSDGQSSRFSAGDVLFGKLRPYLAKVLPATEEGICTGELLVLRPELVIQFFLFHYLLAREFISIVDSSTYGAKMPRASWEFIGNLPVLLPSDNEQLAIADFLDRETGWIDALIEKKERLIELLKEKRQALISHTVTKGLNPNAPMKPSGIEWLGEIPNAWDALPLRRVVKSVKTGGTPSGAEAHYFEDQGYNWYSPSDFSDDVYLGKSNRTLSDLGKKEVPLFPPMTVMIIGIGATIGKVCLSRKESSCNQQINGIDCGDKLNAVFATYYMKTMRDFIMKCGKFTTMPIINQDETKSLMITVPPIAEQHAIGTFLDRETGRIDELIDKINESISKLSEYRTALISAAVTGKIDVREEKAERKPASRKAPPEFKRAVLAAEIVHQLHEEPTFGRIKHQKVLYLCEHHAGLPDLESNYMRDAAGPFDNRMIRSVESQMKRLKWFKTVERETFGIKYEPLEKVKGHVSYYERYWGKYKDTIQSIIDLLSPLDTTRCEIIATLYAAWNDLILEGKVHNDNTIIFEVLNNWHEDKQAIPEERWRKALKWMRDNKLVPIGFGTPTNPKNSNKVKLSVADE